MTENSLNYVIEVLKGEDPTTKPEWYETLGFLYCHRIAGLFYSRANKQNITLPAKVDKLLSDTFYAQVRRNRFMRGEINEISEALISAGAEHIFLKGSVLSNITDGAIYSEGERVSNDIDILVKQDGITALSKALRELGFVQGRYDKEREKIIVFSRMEIISRRMNRGETAPFMKLTGNPEIPFTEVDINFSLGNVPGEKDNLLSEMLEKRRKYDGKKTMYVTNEELFFLHLIMHQYKESGLYFMIERGKDLDLYKLADIYYLWKGNAFDKLALKKIAITYGVQKQVGAVLGQVARIFEDEEILSAAEEYGDKQPEIIDYSMGKRYLWSADERTRICLYEEKRLLSEIKDDK